MLAIGITTAPRKVLTLDRTLDSLAGAGLLPRLTCISAEPASPLPANVPPQTLVLRQSDKRGCLRNWQHLAHTLVALAAARRSSDCPLDWILLLQDDVIVTADILPQLQAIMTCPDREPAAYSIYTNKPMRPRQEAFPGWGLANYNATHGYWGALGLLAHRDQWEQILETVPLQQPQRAHPVGTAPVLFRKIDVLFGRACLEAKLPLYTPMKSLADHIGETSTIGRDAIAAIQANRRGYGFEPQTNAE